MLRLLLVAVSWRPCSGLTSSARCSAPCSFRSTAYWSLSSTWWVAGSGGRLGTGPCGLSLRSKVDVSAFLSVPFESMGHSGDMPCYNCLLPLYSVADSGSTLMRCVFSVCLQVEFVAGSTSWYPRGLPLSLLRGREMCGARWMTPEPGGPLAMVQVCNREGCQGCALAVSLHLASFLCTSCLIACLSCRPQSIIVGDSAPVGSRVLLQAAAAASQQQRARALMQQQNVSADTDAQPQAEPRQYFEKILIMVGWSLYHKLYSCSCVPPSPAARSMATSSPPKS